ncbi:hypothetical protein NL676_018430 [Syzygium grande]|nr:hypothetical protein NL676_018430 [Syzygium grande]
MTEKLTVRNSANLDLRETEFDDPLKLAFSTPPDAPSSAESLAKSFAGDTIGLYHPRIRFPARRRFHMHEQHR